MEQNQKEKTKIHDVQGTPFNIIENNLEFKIVIGTDLASEKTFKNIKEAKRYIYSKPWELIGVLAVKISKLKLTNNEVQKKETNIENNNQTTY